MTRGAMDATGKDETGWAHDRRVDVMLANRFTLAPPQAGPRATRTASTVLGGCPRDAVKLR